MWRKIHSNRDPRDTLFSELRKEFGAYFGMAGNAGKSVLRLYPKVFFGVMVVLLLLSSVLSFTRFRKPVSLNEVPVNSPSPVQTGFSQIMQTTGKIRETLRLKQVVDSISAKKQLTGADSTLLDSTLDRLDQIHQSIK